MKRCIDCRQEHELSKRNLCRNCSTRRMIQNMNQQHYKEGPLYEKGKKHYDTIMPIYRSYMRSRVSEHS